MAGFGRAILIAMIAAASLMLFFNLAFFFPWYLTLVEKSFAVSQIIATNNYLPRVDFENILNDLRGYPIFELRQDDIIITAEHLDEYGSVIKSAIDDTFMTLTDYYSISAPGADENDFSGKPYVQMGNQVLVRISAAYPLQMRLFGNDIHDLFPKLPDIDISFTMTTTTTKHFKDLKYEYIIDPDVVVEEDFIIWSIEPEDA